MGCARTGGHSPFLSKQRSSNKLLRCSEKFCYFCFQKLKEVVKLNIYIKKL